MPSRDSQQSGPAPATEGPRGARPESPAPEAAGQGRGAVADLLQRARADSPRLSPRDVLHLQRTLGNRAVGRLLGRQGVQRTITHNEPPSANAEAAVGEYIGKLDEAVDRAYKYVLHVPTLGKYRNLDGHTEHWAELWEEYQRSGSSALMAAGFGYAVESLATVVYLPPAPGGMDIELQGSRAGTRPDVILKRGADDVAWLDITSLQSEGHIWQKAHWNKAVIHVAEVAYPKMEIAHFNPTADYDDKVDHAEFQKRIHWANYLLQLRRGAWRQLGKQFRPARRRIDPSLRDAARREEVKGQIAAYFGVEVDDRTAASVLWAMNINPATRGLNASVSRSRGESFLLRYDPNLPVIEIPTDGVPRPVPLTEEYLAQLAQLVVVEDDYEEVPYLADEYESKEEEPDESDARALALREPVATYQLELSGMPRITDGLLRSMDAYLAQNQLGISLRLDFGSFQTSLFALPGPTFAESFRAALADLPPVDFGSFQGYAQDERDDDRRSVSPHRRDRSLERRRRIQLSMSLIPFPNRRHRPEEVLPPPTFLALMAPDEVMGNGNGV